MSNLQGESCDGLKQCEYMAWMVLEERKDGDGGAGGKMCNELENPSLNPSAFLLIHNVEQYCLNKESFNM